MATFIIFVWSVNDGREYRTFLAAVRAARQQCSPFMQKRRLYLQKRGTNEFVGDFIRNYGGYTPMVIIKKLSPPGAE